MNYVESRFRLLGRDHGLGAQDDFDSGTAGNCHHAGGTLAARESDHKIGLSLDQHALIANRASGAPLAPPISHVDFCWDSTIARPFGS